VAAVAELLGERCQAPHLKENDCCRLGLASVAQAVGEATIPAKMCMLLQQCLGPPPPALAAHTTAVDADAAAAAAAAGVAGDWDDESIASYIAAEFALRSPHCSSSVELSGLHTGIETTVRRRGAVAAAAAVEVAANAVVPELLGASA